MCSTRFSFYMSLLKKDKIISVILVSVVVLAGLTAPVTAQEEVDTSELKISEVTTPSEVDIDEKAELASDATISDLPADWSAQLKFTAYANNSKLGTQEVSVEDGETVDVSLSHSFEEAGPKEIYFEVTGELTREGALTEQSSSIDRTTPSKIINIVDPSSTKTGDTPGGDESIGDQVDSTSDKLGPEISTEGAAFVAPGSIQDQVDDLRETLPLGEDRVSHAFVLATSDNLYLVLTDKEPVEGYASIQGTELDANEISLDRRNSLEFKPVRATGVEYQEPSKASVGRVYRNTDDYRRDYVEFTANHRSIAIDDEQSDYKLTTGVLVDDPIESEELFRTIGGQSHAMLDQLNRDTVGGVLGDLSRPHIITTEPDTKARYWQNTAVTMTGIVTSPESPAGEFIRSQQKYNTLPTDPDTPVLYVTNSQYNPQSVSISEISEDPSAYEGDTVQFESSLYMKTISSKRIIESTGTKMPPIDTVLHGGVAWDRQPDTRDDLVGVIAASSITQNQLSKERTGTYKVTGEVISTDKIKGNLSQGYVLIAYNLERTGDLDTTSISDLSVQQSSKISKVLQRQTNPTIETSDSSSPDGGTTAESTNSDGVLGDTTDNESNTESSRGNDIVSTMSELVKQIVDLFS
ncbi:hypothetical protein GCM10008994_01840 [Halorubrum ejinorense]|uniref:Uncharacterized protein n=2 Tax=Halorubrum ejinorense TaxID=425309 RepID=A0AAV3SN12_9EURY